MAQALTSEVRSLLADVAITGVVVAHGKKLLWLLGWTNDKPKAWAELLDHWVEIGQARDDLLGVDLFNGTIVLLKPSVAKDSGMVPVTQWAGESDPA